MRRSNKVLMRKLLTNFILKGKITTSEKKAKALKSQIDILLTQAKKDTQAGKSIVKKMLGSTNLTDVLIKQISPIFNQRKSGFVKYIKLTQRESDGSRFGRIEWVEPVVLEKKEIKTVKPSKK